MNYTKLFYWLTVADNAKTLFVTFIWIFTIISVIATCSYFYAGMEEENETQKMCRKWMWWSYPFMILFWSLYIFTPSKKDALLIVAGGQTLNFLTSDSTAKQIPHELSSFVVTELKNMAENAKVDLGIASQKDKILEEAKNMTANQLMDKMRVDSNFAKVILNK
jgi:hypothetical protein